MYLSINTHHLPFCRHTQPARKVASLAPASPQCLLLNTHHLHPCCPTSTSTGKAASPLPLSSTSSSQGHRCWVSCRPLPRTATPTCWGHLPQTQRRRGTGGRRLTLCCTGGFLTIVWEGRQQGPAWGCGGAGGVGLAVLQHTCDCNTLTYNRHLPAHSPSLLCCGNCSFACLLPKVHHRRHPHSQPHA